jgi:hypothetical protein
MYDRASVSCQTHRIICPRPLQCPNCARRAPNVAERSSAALTRQPTVRVRRTCEGIGGDRAPLSPLRGVRWWRCISPRTLRDDLLAVERKVYIAMEVRVGNGCLFGTPRLVAKKTRKKPRVPCRMKLTPLAVTYRMGRAVPEKNTIQEWSECISRWRNFERF